MFGILNLDKPTGITSRDVVNRVQRAIRPEKCGHAGTLDPLATGVLIVGIGRATRLISYVQQLRKTYVGTFLLGYASDTDDTDGQVECRSDAPLVDREQIEAILPQLEGTVMQAPPAYSAVKIAGQRAYARARAGESVAPAPRPVAIYALRLMEFAYPKFQLHVTCGSGTYIRAIGRDLAARLGTTAVMSGLQRTAIGPFQREDALSAENLSRDGIEAALHPPLAALVGMPTVTLDHREVAEVRSGRILFPGAAWPTGPGPTDEMVGLNERGELQAILRRRGGGWGPKLNF